MFSGGGVKLHHLAMTRSGKITWALAVFLCVGLPLSYHGEALADKAAAGLITESVGSLSALAYFHNLARAEAGAEGYISLTRDDDKRTTTRGADSVPAKQCQPEEVSVRVRGADELLREYKKGKRAFRDSKLMRADLREADLRGADLRGANLDEANLEGADLSEANLSGASLRKAYRAGANLSRAKLIGTSLWRANLSGVNLTNADLTEAGLRSANLWQANLYGASVGAVKWSGALMPDGSIGPTY